MAKKRHIETIIRCVSTWTEFAGCVGCAIALFDDYNRRFGDANLTEEGAAAGVAALGTARGLLEHAQRCAKNMRGAFGPGIAAKAARHARDARRVMDAIVDAQARGSHGVPEREQQAFIERLRDLSAVASQIHAAATSFFRDYGGEPEALQSFSDFAAQFSNGVANAC